MRQHLKGHILEGAGGAVPQLQAVGILVHCAHRGHRRGIEFVRPIGGVGIVSELLHRELLQVVLHHINRPLLIGHGHQVLQGLARQFGDVEGGEQSPVLGQSLGDSLGGGVLNCIVPCADVTHSDPSLSL